MKRQIHVPKPNGHSRGCEAHLQALKGLGKSVKPRGDVLLLKGDLDRAHANLEFTGFASMLGRKESMAKARAARLNGRKGGRPRIAVREKGPKPKPRAS